MVNPKKFLTNIGHSLLSLSLEGSGDLAASIIISTRNKSTYLSLALRSLENQCLSSKYWELIVGNDDSYDNTDSVLDFYSKRKKINLQHFRTCRGQGYSYIINTAVQMARGKVVILLNDDHIVSPDFILYHLRRQASAPSCIVGNLERIVHTHLFTPVGNSIDGINDVPFVNDDDLNSFQFLDQYSYKDGLHSLSTWQYFQRNNIPKPNPWIFFGSGNISIPRTMINSIGGLYQGTENWNLDQQGLALYDFSLRLANSDYSFDFEPNAVALRQNKPTKAWDYKTYLRTINCLKTLHPYIDESILANLF